MIRTREIDFNKQTVYKKRQTRYIHEYVYIYIDIVLFFVLLHHLKGIVELQSIAADVGSSLVVVFAVNRLCSLMYDARWVSITVVNSALPQLLFEVF